MRHLKTWKKNSQTVISGYLLSGSADDKISRGHGGRHFYDHDVELSCGLICLKKKRRKISEMINQNF